MRLIRAGYTFLGSETLTIWFLGLFVIYYLTVAVWSEEAFATFVARLSTSSLFRALFLLFFLNVAFRTFGAAKAMLREGRVRFFLRLPLYVGFLVFLFSSFLSLNVRDNRWLLLGEGDIVELEWEEAPLRVVRIDPALDRDVLRTDESRIFDYEPKIILGDRERMLHEIGAFPPKRVSRTFMHILNFGIGPGVELKREGRTVARREFALRLLPFGNVDSFEIEPFPYRFSVKILPNQVIEKGDERARNYNLDRPLYEVQVAKGERMIYEGKTDSLIRFDDVMSLSFVRPSYWVWVEAARDPLLLWYAAGLFLTALGIISYGFSLILSGRAVLLKKR